MKIRMRLGLQIFKQVEIFDGDMDTTLKDISLRVEHPQVITKHNFKAVLQTQRGIIENKMDNINDLIGGSGWQVKKYRNLAIDIFETKPLRASSYIPTPERFSSPKCGLVNIQNKDQECFRWCMKYHQSAKSQNCYRTTALAKLHDRFDYGDMEFPADYNSIEQFEHLNKVCIFIYTYDEEKNEVVVEKQGKTEYILNDCIYLLRIEQEEQSHYVYIKKIESLLNLHHHMVDKDKRWCPMCHKKIEMKEYRSHLSKCYKFCQDSTLIRLPKVGSTMKFKNYKNTLERPYVVYADTECSLCQTCDDSKIAKHEPNSACFYLVCTYDNSKNRLWSSVGKDCITEMVLELNRTATLIKAEMQENERMTMTQEDRTNFRRATCCHICNERGFSEDGARMKVRDHDHKTGKYRGAAHAKCNINYYTNRYLPVVFHNLRGYDSHLVIKKAHEINDKLGNKHIDVIPNSYEKFMSFSIGDLKFIDSLQFMPSSLEKLVENLQHPEERYRNYNSMKREFPEHYEMLCQKGVYPYEFVDDISKLDHPGLPPIESFYSKLRQEGISREDYERAQKVYATLNCSSFKDYHMTYLKTDVLLLADVFENFRKVCRSYYRLDPANYLSAPSLAWDAMLLLTGIELDLITNRKMLDVIERMKRGGLCFVGSKRHVKANNKYLEDFDPSQPSNYLMYWDANNLYGWAMSELLPYKGLVFDKRTTLQQVLETADNSETGYIVECDLRYPRELHEKFREFPPCPENLTPELGWFSEFQRQVGEKTNVIKKNDTFAGTPKLVPHLMEHKNYVLHYRNLKFIKELGVEIGTVHNVVKFKQKPWLGEYIAFNTLKRQQATNDFEKDFSS
jgi:hypothetical protein